MKNYPQVYNQRTGPWAGQRLGTVNGTTIGGQGCYVTSFAMKAGYYGHQITPNALDNLFTSKNIYVSGNLTPDNALTRIYPDLTMPTVLDYGNTPADLGKLRDLMADPNLTVTLELDFDHQPNDGIQTHFVECADCDGTKVMIFDPWFTTGQADDFTTHYGNDPAQTILKFVVYKGNPKGNQPMPDPTTSGLPANFADIVHGSSEWDATVGAYLPAGTQPKSAVFEDVQKVVAAYKGQTSSAQGQLNTVSTQLATAIQDSANKDQKISTLTQQLADLDNSWKVRYDALNKTAGSVAAVTAQYEGTVAGLKTQFTDEQDAHHVDLLKLATVTEQLSQCQSASNSKVDLTTFSVAQLISAIISKFKK